MKALGLFFAFALSLLLLAACQQDDSKTPTTLQELRLNLGSEPFTLDPQRASILTEFSVIRQVFQGLLGFAPDLSLEPVVATQVPTKENGGISEDGLAYTFTLRDDVTWSDGQELTADDFVFAIKRLFDPRVAAQYSVLYGAISGGMAFNQAAGADDDTLHALEASVQVQALDPHTLRVTLDTPNPTFLQKMALINVFPVRRDMIEAHGVAWTEPATYLGNGPFVMTEWQHQDHITLEANPNYWGPTPALDRITLRMIGDVNSELTAYRNNELDISRVPSGTEPSILDDSDLSSQLLRTSDLFTLGLFFNNSNPPFDSLEVRRAFTNAVDRDAWISQVSNGVGKPALGWLPPGMPGYEASIGADNTFNPQQARQLLANAGYPGGQGFPDLTFTYPSGGGQGLFAQFVQAQLKDNLDIQMDLEPLDPPAYFGQVMGARQFQITGLGWGADYPDPESFLAGLFMSGSPQNIVGYSNPQYDQLAGQAISELDQETRLDLWMQAHRLLVEDVPVGFVFHQERFFLKKPHVKGLALTGIDGFIPGDSSLSRVSVSD